MEKTVYFDTTFPSYMFDERESIKNYVEETQKWWNQERQNYEIWISEETIAELSRGDYPHKIQSLEFIQPLSVLPYDTEIDEIAQIYIDNYLMPKELKGDAIHLAYSSFYKIDYLMTWNCNHLANANKKQHILIINTRLRLSTPEIITPLVLFTEDSYVN